MELNLQRQTITINETIFNAYVEQPIECDALLPDYCPDIVKVLKCNAQTHVTSTSVSGERLTIEGIAVAHVYYTSEGDQIRHAEYKIPFGKAVELRTAPADPLITVIPSVDYVNCRAVNQRRIDVRGALSLSVKVVDRKEQQVICDAEGGGLQLRRDMIPVTELLGQSRMEFPIIEDLDLGAGKSPVGSILRSSCRVHAQDHKVIAGKVVVKGDFLLHILYQPAGDENALETMDYTLPISQIVDCENADENSVCDLELYVVNCDVQPKSNDDGEYLALALDAKLCASVTAHRHTEVPVASDCYSTKYESACTRQEVKFVKLEEIVAETLMHKVTLDLPEGVDSVLDAWCDVDTLTWKYEQESLALNVNLTISMFAKMESGECMYFEQPSELQHIKPVTALVPDSIQFDPSSDVLSCTYNLVGKEKIDLRCEVTVKGCVYSALNVNSVHEIKVDEEKAKVKEQNKLYIYYADEGESVWDIAKRYNTSANMIWEENAIESDVLEKKCMLLIPIV